MIAAAADPREVARQILNERRFRHGPIPQPLRKPLHSLGDTLQRAFHDAFHWTAGVTPGGRWAVWILLIALLFAITVYVSRRGIRRTTVAAALAEQSDTAGQPSRRELERAAEAAERSGDFDAAVRLRFGAGLAGLAQGGVIEERPSVRNAEVAATLRSDDFDAVARSFDEVVYGGRAAVADDARHAREGWKTILRQARR